jgi:hypothetical protein
MKKRISRISVHRTSLVLALVYAVLALIFMPFILAAVLTGEGEHKVLAAIFVLVDPVLFGLCVYAVAAVSCFLYNLVAKYTGGIEVSVTDATS